jgi:hypothetical protein
MITNIIVSQKITAALTAEIPQARLHFGAHKLAYTPATGGGRVGTAETVFREECETTLFDELMALSATAEVRLFGEPVEGIVCGDQALSRYPVLKIHPTAAKHTIKKAIIMARLTPALISEVP